jgi:purine-binding chemotaxis protein CheW
MPIAFDVAITTSTSDMTGNDAPRQVLTFSLGSEVYGVDILRVKEIRGWSPATRIPHAPPCVLGVLNLRGAIMPVVDLRVRFALPAAEFTPLTVIIVLSIRTAHGHRECGVVVDEVRDVVDIAADAIRPAPAMAASGASEFIQGIATINDQLLILLDADELATQELPRVAADTAA